MANRATDLDARSILDQATRRAGTITTYAETSRIYTVPWIAADVSVWYWLL